ncbi:MAG: hypothetical protein ABIK73_07860, partial [candidate division WOR-3 bacterium]
RLGKLIMGIIKLLLASFLFTIVNRIAEMTSDVRIGDATIPLGLIVGLIIAFFPLMLLISAMRDMGIGF